MPEATSDQVRIAQLTAEIAQLKEDRDMMLAGVAAGDDPTHIGWCEQCQRYMDDRAGCPTDNHDDRTSLQAHSLDSWTAEHEPWLTRQSLRIGRAAFRSGYEAGQQAAAAEAEALNSKRLGVWQADKEQDAATITAQAEEIARLKALVCQPSCQHAETIHDPK